MRSATAGELTTLGLTTRAITPRIKVANGSGTMIDLTSWFEHASIEHDIDQPVGGATVSFSRASGATQSLSPLRTDSTLNVKDDLTYAPLLDLNRSITIEVATNPIGTAPVAGDYKMQFKGTIDVVEFERTPVRAICRDLGAPLVDRWIETEATYGSGGGTAIQTVMQNILDAVFGGGVYTLYVPVSPGANVTTYRQQKMSVMDALQDLAQQIGWDVRFKWDDGTSTFRLTLSEPPRTKTTPDYTFAPSAYHDFTRLSLDVTNIRNVITGSFRNSADLGNRAVVTVSDSPSIAKYGRRFFFIQEADVSPIDTSAEMTTMLDAALADMKEPKAEQEVDMPFFWPADISDLYRYSSNAVHYDSNQDIAVVELTHELSRNFHRTRALVRGTPIGQYATWLGRGEIIGPGGGAGGEAKPPRPYITPLNTEADEIHWNLRFNSANGSGGGGTNLAYTVKRKKDFADETTLSSGNASAFPLDLNVTRDPKQNAVLTFRVTDAATGMFAEAIYPIPAYTPGFDSTGLGITSGTTESGGKAIDRLFAKLLPADVDNLDSVGNGTTYARPLATRISAGKPFIDFSEAFNLNKNLDYLADTSARFAAPVPNATSDITLVAGTGITLRGNTASHVGSSWSGHVYSKDGYTGGAFAQAIAGSAAMFGLNTDPLTDESYTSIDYAIHSSSDGNLYAYESGAGTVINASWAASDVLAVTYDGSNVRYFQNGVVRRTLAVAVGLKLFFDSSFASNTLENIRFGPMSSNNAAAVGAGNFITGINESGGKAVNRIFAKALAADPDTLDSAADGSTYKRIVSVSGGQATNASIADVAGGKLTAGTLVSGILESGGKAVNRQFAKALAGDADTLDSTPDGTTYKKVTGVVSSLITPSSSTPRNRCKVNKNGSNQTIGGGVVTLVWAGENYDSNNLHDNATNNNRITVPSGGAFGVWRLTAQVAWDANATGYRECDIRKNGAGSLGGTTVLGFSNGGLGPVTNLSVDDDAPAEGDYYDVFVIQNSGTDRTVVSSLSFFSAVHNW